MPTPSPPLSTTENIRAAVYTPNIVADRPPGHDNVQNVANQGTPGNNQVQNAQVRSVVRILDLTPDQKQQLHLEITGQNYNYEEILQTAEDMFGK